VTFAFWKKNMLNDVVFATDDEQEAKDFYNILVFDRTLDKYNFEEKRELYLANKDASKFGI
jgi:hypothetical protein